MAGFADREIADSEDEEEFLLGSQEEDEQQKKESNQPSTSQHGPDNGTHEKSTGSTEYFDRRMLDAERVLVQPSSVSDRPSTQGKRTKRRNSVDDETSSTSTTERAPKRLKTDPSQRAARFLDDDTVLPMSPNALPALRSSDSPGHLMRLGFVEHEPMAMFRDTGSTIQDNVSSQVRLYGPQADPNGALLHENDAVDAAQQSGAQSSPFPWSTGNPTQTTNGKSKTAGTDPKNAASGGPIRNEPAADTLGHPTNAGRDAEQASQEQPDDNKLNRTGGDEQHEDDHHDPEQFEDHRDPERPEEDANAEPFKKPHSSPFVEIPIVRSSTKPKAHEAKQTSSSRKTKKQQQEEEASPSSEDWIGLPKEGYIPRPTKRRATQVASNAIDYSVVPEKAAKAKTKSNKRRKTAGDRGAVPNLGPLPKDMNMPQPTPIDVDELSQKSQEIVPEGEQPSPVAEPTAVDSAGNPNDSTGSSQIAVTKTVLVEETTIAASPKPVSSQEKRLDKDGFAIPSPIPKSSSRSRRHHTTIFEDHTNFRPSQKSPTLVQQQENRSEALADLTNIPSGKKARQSRPVVVDSDDEDDASVAPEDENTAGPDEQPLEVVEEPPKKRGRGRPPKNAGKASAKAVEKPTEPEKDTGTDSSIQKKAPKKKAAKKTARKEPEKPIEVDSDTMDESAEPQVEPDALPPQPTPTEDDASGVEARTKSPTETPEPKPAASAKTSPTAKHTALSHSTSAPYRVGLSKRQRIPSLLRMRKPVPPKKAA